MRIGPMIPRFYAAIRLRWFGPRRLPGRGPGEWREPQSWIASPWMRLVLRMGRPDRSRWAARAQLAALLDRDPSERHMQRARSDARPQRGLAT
jgi:hypothetical protein